MNTNKDDEFEKAIGKLGEYLPTGIPTNIIGIMTCVFLQISTIIFLNFI